MTAPVLRADNVHVRLGRRAALTGIDVTIEPGAFTIVVGPNGAGKTTLLRALAGLVRLKQGAITIGASSLTALPSTERAKIIAYLPQGGGIAWPIAVASVVALGRMPHREESDRSETGRRAVADAIAAVGLKGFETRPASELSGGERARLLLARALATNAPILLADEPVAALDPHHQLRVIEVLRTNAHRGSIVVAVMHDLALAARFADRVLMLRDGRLVAEGPPREVLTSDRLAATFDIEASVTERDKALLLMPWRALV